MKKVLITGGAGFIGSHVVELLSASGYIVTVLDNLSTGDRANISCDIELINMDIRNIEELEKVFLQKNFDYVIHNAAQTKVGHSMDDPLFDGHVNILGTLNTLECCRKFGVKRVVYPSSAAVYGNPDVLPIDENTPTIPLSFYGLSKLVPESYLRLYSENFGLEYVILRYSNVYGERQGSLGEGGVVNVFMRSMLSGSGIKIYGDGKQTRDFIYVKDIAQANLKALQSSNPNCVVNISTNNRISVNELLTALELTLGYKVDVQYEAQHQGDIKHSALANRLAIELLDWIPATSLKDGLTKMADAIQAKTK